MENEPEGSKVLEAKWRNSFKEEEEKKNFKNNFKNKKASSISFMWIKPAQGN